MRNSIAAYKESLSRIANEVLDAAEEIDVPRSNGAAAAEDAPTPGRRSSRRSPRLTPPVGSPAANGAGSGSTDEIAKYKADIQKLQTSEAEIKALSFNYASILKEKEEQLSKLREENSSLRKSLEAKSAVEHESRDDSQKTLSNNSNVRKPVPVAVSAAVPARVASMTVSAAPVRAVVTAAIPARIASTGIADQSPIRSPRHINQISSRSTGSHALKDNVTRSDGFSNGTVRLIEFDAMQRKIESISTNSQGNGEDHANLLEENHRYMAAVQASHESEIEQLKVLLDSEHENATIIKLKLQEEQRLNESSQKELHDLKMDKERISSEMIELHKELNKKISELRRLQVELNRRDMEEKNESLESMKDTIGTLEKENAKLKIEKDELEASLKLCMKCAPENLDADDLDNQNRKSIKSNEVIEEMTLSILQLEDTLKDTCTERDKAIQEVARLKQHLLDKELEDTDKMDEDSKIIEELTATSEYQRAQILQLEKALRQERTKKEDIDKRKSDDIQRSNELIDRLKQKLADCMRTVDSKNVELLNLQTALGQYYAEIEAKERLGRDLAMTREETATLSESLKVANQGLETVEREKEDIAAKLLQAERMLLEGKLSIQKLGEDNSKLRRALEQSMMRLNRMSLDSDNYVDRRIVIKLLVTYFQRNHSKEVLDLMVRMLGFSEEDKQRIGFAQHVAGKGVVRGVLGLPGRLVGGILGGSSPEASSPLLSENQSFADLWVDFLLKATEERERRESSEAAGVLSSAQDKATNTRMPSVLDHGTNLPNTVPRFPTVNLSANQIPSLRAKQNPFIEHSDSEFATVPLTSAVSPSESSSSSSLPPRY